MITHFITVEIKPGHPYHVGEGMPLDDLALRAVGGDYFPGQVTKAMEVNRAMH